MTPTIHDRPGGDEGDLVAASSVAGAGASVNRRVALASLLGAVLATASACRSVGDEDGAAPSDQEPFDDRDATVMPRTQTPSATEVPSPMARTRDADIHVLRRLTFGPTVAAAEHLRTVGFDRWLDEQLAPGELDTDAVDDELAAAFPQLRQSAADMLADYQADGNGPQLAVALPGATLVRHMHSPAQLQERLVEFWGDHFNVPQVNPRAVVTRIEMDRMVFRPHALGRFDDLLIATVQSPAMLLYLDNFRSTAGSINENHARELLELHTVGVGGGYDEDDIVAVARLLTGWGITRTLEFRFHSRTHDDAPVSVLGWNRPTGGDPVEHGVEFLRHLARLPETARHVSRKLAVRFVADDPDEELVAAMAAAWIDNDTDIAAVIRTMVTHPAFADAPPKFNRPWDYLVQTLRSLDAQIDPTNRRDVRTLVGMVTDLGQTPFRWPSPDGYPDVEPAWLNTGSLLARWNLTTQLAASDDRSFPTNLTTQRAELSGRSADETYDALSELLRQEPVTDGQRALLAELTGWAPDHVPTDDELDQVTPHVAFVLLAGPTTLYR